jgi:hypothetical protein
MSKFPAAGELSCRLRIIMTETPRARERCGEKRPFQAWIEPSESALCVKCALS